MATTFPSPYGDYGSYLKEEKERMIYYDRVSVPLRGLWFLSSVFSRHGYRFSIVSVPLRGLWFLSKVDTKQLAEILLVSVPLRGLWFLSPVLKLANML